MSNISKMTRVAIVTGGNGNFGKYICKYLLKKNFFVYSVDLTFSKIKSKNFKSIILDIRNESDLKIFFKKIDKIDLLINNAGIGVFTPTLKRTVKEFKDVLDINLLGNFLMSQKSLKIMKRNKSGKIINIGSIYGIKSSDPRIYGKSGRNNSEVYSVSKAGVIMLTKYLAAHFGSFNIQINCISPGGIYANQNYNFVKKYKSKVPVGRMASLNDFDSVIDFLIDEKNIYTNGANIVIDGGFTAW